MKDIAIFGAGGQGREVLQLIRQINEKHPRWNCIGWFDDGLRLDYLVDGLPVLGGIAELNERKEELALHIAIGWPATKRKVVERITNPNIYYPTLIHPDVCIDPRRVQIGEGTMIAKGSLLTVDIRIGKHVLVNLGTILTHDCQIGDYTGLMPSVNISGEVKVGKGCYIGTGAQVIQQKKVGDNSIIGAGAVVIQDIPPGCTAVGVPARIIKSENEKELP